MSGAIISVRKAHPGDAEQLTAVSFISKRHWPYPDEHFDIWIDELTITPEYVADNIVYVAERCGIILGYYSIVENPVDRWVGKIFLEKGFWLEHLFILPKFIGQGLGFLLLEHAKTTARERNNAVLDGFVDHRAKRFYEEAGAHT